MIMTIVVIVTVHGSFVFAGGERRGRTKGFLAASASAGGSFRFLFADVHHLVIAAAAAAAITIAAAAASTSMGKMELQQQVVDVW